MHLSRVHLLRRGFLLLLALVFVGCSLSMTTTSGAAWLPIKHRPVHLQIKSFTTTSPAIDVLTNQILTNMEQHAWNTQAMTRKVVTGGLYINWKMSDPSITNVTNPGEDGDVQHNHDPQVDLLYLESLAEYQQLHPQDHTYDSEVVKATAMVLTDFQNYSMPKGWIYFALLKSGTLLQNTALINDAHNVANNFYKRNYDPKLGFVYDHSHKPGNYNTDHTLVSGVALIDAGLRFNTPIWVSAGESTINHTIAVALNPNYHLFYDDMIVSQNGHDKVSSYKAKTSMQGQIIDALLTAYTLVHNPQYLNVATQALQAMLQSTNMWDAKLGGYYFAFDLQTGKPITAYKETRGQSLMLLALHRYNELMNQQYASQEQQALAVLVNNFYEPTYHGYFYRMTPDFHVFVRHENHSAIPEDAFTTEAMGGAMDALQTTELS